MKKLATLWLLLLCAALATPSRAQTFPVDTLVKTGPLAKRINLVFISDGYQASEMALFRTRATAVINSLFAQSPFLEYRPYFNVFAIEVPSAQSGSTHPRTAADCGTTAAFSASTYFNSTFDYGGIHRLLVPQANAAVGTVLANNFPRYDQVFVLVNSTEYGGSGGALATASANTSATEIMVHEIGHSMAALADEYWAGSQYAREAFNMTQTTNPTTVRWAPWVGTNSIGIYPYSTDPSWQKPHQNCKMQFLGVPFCAVCREAFVEKFHTLVSPLQAYSPATLAINAPTQNLSFALTLLPPTPNTLRVTWTRDGTVFARNTATATATLAQLPVGTHVVRATVVDTTALTRRATHLTQHTYTVDWTINRTNTGVSMASTTAEYEVETYPNPVGEVLNLSYTLPRPAPVAFTVLDAAGRVVKTIRYGRQAPGRYQYALRPEELNLRAAGIYTLLINVDGIVLNRQLVKE
ncbi:M64 family metallopeptidase [Hymenobacter negativus]|uniref:FlgD/Vpr Ig-like domain-containing protein n=1 Tax=Hymenobacter negativus TaxID=2795026 RepID=A0ABS0Q4B5_9BACT|nr:M64 family metallopeptidase [Hymenobacter negativus]MBH8557510.1 hypothetical protein [Hymenobacter negativus]